MATKKCPYCAEEIQGEAIKCRHCGSMLPPPEGAYGAQGAAAPQPVWPDSGVAPRRRLFRSQSDRFVMGICGGLARYFNLDSTLVRVGVVLASFCTVVLPALILYFILALVIPPDPSGA